MTPHINAKPGDYADTVLMPGDPARAAFIVKHFLDDAICVNDVRNNEGYTGTFKGKRISVQASGMGQPSIGIYSNELYNFYGVEKIVRVGTCGAFHENMNLGDVVVAMTASTDNSPVKSYNLAPHCDFDMMRDVIYCLTDHNIKHHVGSILSTDYFYNHENEGAWKKIKKLGILGVDMETHMLYYTSMRYGKKALTVNMVSDNLETREEFSSADRVTAVYAMVGTVLESLL